jgi:hypothetical protein
MALKETIHLKMADFCKDTCPACVTARKKQQGMAYKFVAAVDERCPACKSYKDVYGKLAHEPIE